jgi:uncharacterized SAM-binding protein YcdF (DUF218 family)
VSSVVRKRQSDDRSRAQGIPGLGLVAAGRTVGRRRPLFTAARAGAFGVAVLAAAIVVVVANPDALATFLRPEDRLAPADAALVFSGDPNYARTLEAVRLYRAGYVRYLVFSGAGGPGDSAASMARVALRNRVPPAALLLDGRARSTYQNVLFVRGLLTRHHVHTLILVTTPYHQRRAYLVARHLLPTVVLINRPIQAWYWRPHGWWRDPPLRNAVVDEYMKIAGYLLLGRI